MLQVNKDQNGGTVKIDIGESFEIQLPENPTTGYRWNLLSSGQPVLEMQEDSFLTAAGPPGASGVRRWRFRAVQEGPTEVEFANQRSWEKKAIDTFQITVKVTRQ